jgi:diacylglycerol kinase family enzyme
LDELRSVLAHAGIDAPAWHEVPKSKKAPKQVRQAVADGADLVFIWGGDGMVQRCLDELAGTGVTAAIIPAGTANLLATDLGIPRDLQEAVTIGLHGRRRPLDLGTVNGEHFAVMAGTGFDALMIKDTDKSFKRKAGRAAYLWTGAKNLRADRVPTRVRVDGVDWFEGEASCVMVANVGTIIGGITAFEEAETDDGVLEVGVVTAEGAIEWSRVLARMASGSPERSPFARKTAGRKIDIKLDEKRPYELDGGDRPPSKKLKMRVVPAGVNVCVPDEVAS